LAALILAQQRCNYLGDWKLGRLKQARWSFLGAIACLVALSFVLAVVALA
jgi:hypothetical protein